MAGQDTRDKAVAIRRHVKRRALERFGWTLNRHDLSFLRNLIRSGEATLIEKQSNRIGLYKTEYRDQEIVLVYDKNRKLIVSLWSAEEINA